MVASIVPEDTSQLRGGSKDKTFFFSEINHVEDQNGVYSTLKRSPTLDQIKGGGGEG